jgi:hypothetical protein
MLLAGVRLVDTTKALARALSRTLELKCREEGRGI